MLRDLVNSPESTIATETVSVTVILPMRNAEKDISRCINAILANDYPSGQVEIIVVDSMSTDASPDLVRSYANRHSFIRLLVNPKKLVSVSLNMGLDAAQGGVIIRADARSVMESDYISRAVKLLCTTDALNVGGAQRATGASYLTRAVALATNSPYAIGDARLRNAQKEKWVDGIYLGAWWRETLESLGGFDGDLAYDENYDLSLRLRRMRGKAFYSPSLRSSYRVRGSIPSFIKTYVGYGYGMARAIKRQPDALRPSQLAAPGVVLMLMISGLFALYSWPSGIVAPAFYILHSLVTSRRITHIRRYQISMSLVLITLHICWGTGFIAGIIRWGIPRRRTRSLLKAMARRGP
jgi:succinoglycan biosynthesis protein ExoA